MLKFYKISTLSLWVSLVFATPVDVGNPLEYVETEHDGDPGANLTTFTLDGSGSEDPNIVTYHWEQISSGPYLETFTDTNGNGVWDDAEEYVDDNGNGSWDPGETLTDRNNNEIWDDAEEFVDVLNGVYDEGEEFVDANGNDEYDEGEEWIDAVNGVYDFEEVQQNGAWSGLWNENPAIVTFDAGVAYNQDPRAYQFRLTVINTAQQSISARKIVVVSPEANNPPVVTFKNLDSYVEDYTDSNSNGQWDEGEDFIDLNGNQVWDGENSIQCGGSTEGGEDGFECVLLFLDDTYIDSVSDPEGDVPDNENYFWENNEGEIETALYSFEFQSPSESHVLRVVAIDTYADITEAVLYIKSSIVNTPPNVILNSLFLNN